MAMAVAAAVVGGAAVGGVMGANTPNALTIDQWASAKFYSDLSADRGMRDTAGNLYNFGVANPWQTPDGGEPRTTPYQSAYNEGTGYYVDAKTGQVISQDVYNRRSREGRDSGFNRRGRYQWVALQKTPAAEAGNSPVAMTENTNEWLAGMQPRVFDFEEKKFDAAESLLQPGTDAQLAGYQHVIDTMPEKTAADIATYKFTQNAMPEKWSLVQSMSALARRNNENEAARMAGAEVSQQYNTLEKTLGDDIRRTGAVAGSGRMAGLQADLDLRRVKDTAGARTSARNTARQTQYQNLATAVQLL